MFNTIPERQEFFHKLTLGFDRRWPLRVNIFPTVPFLVVLDHTQQQEVTHKQGQLCQVHGMVCDTDMSDL